MAKGSIEKRGESSYRLIVSSGLDNSGRQIKHTKTVKRITRSEADTELAKFIAEIEKGNTASSGKMTLTHFYDYWKANHANKNHEATTLAYNESLFTRIKQALGSKRIDKIEPRHLLAFYQNLTEPGIRKDTRGLALSTNTIRKHHVLLKSLFTKAVQWNMLSYNPAARVEPPKATHTIKEVYTQEQLGLFLQALENAELKYKLMVMLTLTGGLRREEIFALEWNNIDTETNTLQINKASVYTPATGIITKGTKTRTSNRRVSIPASVIALLEIYKIQQSAKRLKLGNKWRPDSEEKDMGTERLFTTWEGKPAHPDSFYTWMKKFTTANNLPHISPHLFRHMNATYLIAGGADIRTVSGKLGHAQNSTTMNIYSHLIKSAETETANTMEAFLHDTRDKAQRREQEK